MFVIMAVATDTRAVGAAAAIAIGGTVGLDALFGGAGHRRLDEPGALVRAGARVRRVDDFWIYVVGPIVGAALGALAYQLVRGEHPPASDGLMAHVLFVCLHNAGRSQMSQALFERAADGRHDAPLGRHDARPSRVHPEVVEVDARARHRPLRPPPAAAHAPSSPSGPTSS